MQMLLKFLRLPMTDRLMLIEAGLLTGLARLSILTLPFRWIAPQIGRHSELTGEASDPHDANVKKRVAWAIQVVAARTPWESKCLVQAMTARSMLARRGVAGTVYLGLAKELNGELKAHAWLRSGETIVTGAAGMTQFTVLSTFAFDGKPFGSRKAQVRAAS